jgi:hypothetical protein
MAGDDKDTKPEESAGDGEDRNLTSDEAKEVIENITEEEKEQMEKSTDSVKKKRGK